MASPLGISGTTSRIPFSNCCSTTVFKSLHRLSSFLIATALHQTRNATHPFSAYSRQILPLGRAT